MSPTAASEGAEGKRDVLNIEMFKAELMAGLTHYKTIFQSAPNGVLSHDQNNERIFTLAKIREAFHHELSLTNKREEDEAVFEAVKDCFTELRDPNMAAFFWPDLVSYALTANEEKKKKASAVWQEPKLGGFDAEDFRPKFWEKLYYYHRALRSKDVSKFTSDESAELKRLNEEMLKVLRGAKVNTAKELLGMLANIKACFDGLNDPYFAADYWPYLFGCMRKGHLAEDPDEKDKALEAGLALLLKEAAPSGDTTVRDVEASAEQEISPENLEFLNSMDRKAEFGHRYHSLAKKNRHESLPPFAHFLAELKKLPNNVLDYFRTSPHSARLIIVEVKGADDKIIGYKAGLMEAQPEIATDNAMSIGNRYDGAQREMLPGMRLAELDEYGAFIETVLEMDGVLPDQKAKTLLNIGERTEDNAVVMANVDIATKEPGKDFEPTITYSGSDDVYHHELVVVRHTAWAENIVPCRAEAPTAEAPVAVIQTQATAAVIEAQSESFNIGKFSADFGAWLSYYQNILKSGQQDELMPTLGKICAYFYHAVKLAKTTPELSSLFDEAQQCFVRTMEAKTAADFWPELLSHVIVKEQKDTETPGEVTEFNAKEFEEKFAPKLRAYYWATKRPSSTETLEDLNEEILLAIEESTAQKPVPTILATIRSVQKCLNRLGSGNFAANYWAYLVKRMYTELK